MGLFSKSQSTTIQETKLSSTDNRVAATDNATALGAGASINTNIQTLDADVAKTAMASSTYALDKSLSAQSKTIEDALFFSAKESSQSRDLVSRVLEASDKAKPPDPAASAASPSYSSVGSFFAPTPADTGNKKALIIAGVILSAALLFVALKPKLKVIR